MGGKNPVTSQSRAEAPRKRHRGATGAPPVEPHVIHPHAVYTAEQVRRLLGLKEDTLGREIKLGRIRVSRRAGRYYLLGAWVLTWIEAGEVRPSRDGASTVEGAEPFCAGAQNGQQAREG